MVIVFASIFVLFLPGLIISWIFFDHKQIDIMERIALSFALSISIVPIVVFYLNLLGIKINRVNVTMEILFIIAISVVILAIKMKIKK